MLYDKDKLYSGFTGFDEESSVVTTPSSTGISSDPIPYQGDASMGSANLEPMSGVGIAPVADQPPAVETSPAAAAQPQGAKRFGPDWFGLQAKGEARQQRKQSADAESLRTVVSAMEHGISMRAGLEGEELAKFDATYGAQLDKIMPGMGVTYAAMTKRPDMLSQFKDYQQYLPEPMQAMLKSQPKEFLKFAGTAEGQKALGEAKDRFDMRLATKKIQTTKIGLQQYVPADKLKAIMSDGVLTASDIMDVQQYLPKELQLSEPQLQAIQRNDKMFWNGLGVLHGDAEQRTLESRAKGKDKNAQPPTKDVDGITYQWDPEKKLGGARLGTDDRYVKLGAGQASGDKEAINREFRLRDDYRQDTGKFKDVVASFKSTTDYMANRAENKTSAGDQALAYAYAKSRDPNDRLAVSETKDLKNLGNIFQRFQASIESLVDKGQVLPDSVAKEMYAEVRRSFRERNAKQRDIETEYRDTAKRMNVSDKFVRQHSITMPEDEKPAKAAEPSAADIRFTALKHNITEEEVRRRLKAKSGS